MKTIKQIFTVSLLVVFMLGSFTGNAQSTNGKTLTVSKIIDLSQIGTNSTILEYKNSKERIMAFNINKDKKGSTTILPNFDNTKFDNVRVELYNGKKLVAKYLDNKEGGPNNTFDNFIFYENEIPFKTYVNSKEEFWPLVAGIVLCCVHAEVTYSQSEGWSGTLGFDCDCFSKKSSSSNPKVISIKGKKYNITKVKIIPLNQTQKNQISVSNLSISLN